MTNYIRNQGYEEKRGSKKDPKVLLSFEFLDIKQGQSLRDWSNNNDIIKLAEIGQILNKLSVSRALADQIIKQYDTSDKTKWNQYNMPKVSKFEYPSILPREDVPWSKIELGRKLRVIGFLEANIFYVVFLDNEHKFYPSIV